MLRLDTARLTTDRPRARFSCMTESFTLGFTPRCVDGRAAVCGRVGLVGRWTQRWVLPDRPWIVPCWVVGIFPLSSHPVITVVRVWTRSSVRPRTDRRWTRRGRGWMAGRPWSAPADTSWTSRSPRPAVAAGSPDAVHPDARDRGRAQPGCPHRPRVFHGIVPLSTTMGRSGPGFQDGPARAKPWDGSAFSARHQLPDRGLAAQLIVDRDLAIDLVAGVEHRRMVSSAQLGPDPEQRASVSSRIRNMAIWRGHDDGLRRASCPEARWSSAWSV